jgi:hypothetical protein
MLEDEARSRGGRGLRGAFGLRAELLPLPERAQLVSGEDLRGRPLRGG